MKFRVVMALVALLVAPLAAPAQEAFVVPSADEMVEGDANNTIPFSVPGGNARYQQVYLDDDIPPGPFTIYGIAFRPDALQGPFEYVIPDVDIYLGTTPQGTELNTEFALNIGTEMLVASGELPLASAAIGPPGGPLDFDIEIWFDEPFEYDGGNLLLDVYVDPYPMGVVPLFDAANMQGDPIGRVFSAGLIGGSVDATSGTADTEGLVTKFMLAPEPAGCAIAALATVAVLGRRRGTRARPATR